MWCECRPIRNIHRSLSHSQELCPLLPTDVTSTVQLAVNIVISPPKPAKLASEGDGNAKAAGKKAKDTQNNIVRQARNSTITTLRNTCVTKFFEQGRIPTNHLAELYQNPIKDVLVKEVWEQLEEHHKQGWDHKDCRDKLIKYATSIFDVCQSSSYYYSLFMRIMSSTHDATAHLCTGLSMLHTGKGIPNKKSLRRRQTLPRRHRSPQRRHQQIARLH